uniref:Uncharacterized protein n=1 Tax=Oryza brachyantha TaxID=4533 RepID=A0A1V1H796_ORYBR|nr:hypothetical protein [Oryza brachyantha]
MAAIVNVLSSLPQPPAACLQWRPCSGDPMAPWPRTSPAIGGFELDEDDDDSEGDEQPRFAACGGRPGEEDTMITNSQHTNYSF